MAAPGQVEVTAWMARTGRGAADAVDHFCPGMDPDQRQKLAAKFRVWKQRDGQDPVQRAPNMPAGGDDAPAAERIVVEDRHLEPCRLDRIPFLERQLARLEATMESALAQGNIGRVPQLDARISEVRQHLDSARGEAGRTVALDRNPGAVAEEVERRAKRIAQLAAARAKAPERDL